MHWVETHGQEDSYDIFETIDLFKEQGAIGYWEFNRDSSTWLLSILSVGLLVAFSILVYNIKVYYKEKMQI